MSTGAEIIIFIVALIISVSILIFVLTLIPAINQFKFLMKDMEKTSAELREVAVQAKIMSKRINYDLEKVDMLIDSSYETVEAAKNTFQFLNTYVFQKSSTLFSMIPAIRFGWKIVKKFTRRKNNE